MSDIKPVKMCINITIPSIDDDSISLYEAVGILASKMQEAIAEVNKNLGILSTAYSASNPPPYPVKSVNNAITQNVQTVFITEGVDFNQIPQSELIAACKAGAKIAAEPMDDNTFNIYLMELLSQPERVVYYPLKQNGVTSAVTSVNNQIGAVDIFKAPISAATKENVAAITPDDTAVDGKPWTSKKTVDTLCPPLDKSGNPVICYPVAGYPLGVMVSWTPTQEGSGNPSPENIRPIQGRNSVNVERQEDNLAYTITLPETVYGGEVNAVSGEGQREWRYIALTGQEPYHIFSTFFYIDLYKIESFVAEPAFNTTDGKCSHYQYQLYAPNGFVGITNDGASMVYSPGEKYPITNDGIKEWMDYLAAQYAAGTPVQICYKVANNVPFTATGGTDILAISGTNTFRTNAGSVTVTGRADPIQAIAKLSDRIAALEAAATNITE